MLAGRSAALPQRATMAPTTPALPSSRMLPAALTAQAPAANSRRAGLTVQVWLVVRPPLLWQLGSYGHVAGCRENVVDDIEAVPASSRSIPKQSAHPMLVAEIGT